MLYSILMAKESGPLQKASRMKWSDQPLGIEDQQE